MSKISDFYDRLYGGEASSYIFYYNGTAGTVDISSSFYNDLPAVYELTYDMWSGNLSVQDWYDATNSYSLTGSPVLQYSVCPKGVCISGNLPNPYKILELGTNTTLWLNDDGSFDELSYEPFKPASSSASLTSLFSDFDYTDAYSACYVVGGLLLFLVVLLFSVFRFLGLLREGGRKW